MAKSLPELPTSCWPKWVVRALVPLLQYCLVSPVRQLLLHISRTGLQVRFWERRTAFVTLLRRLLQVEFMRISLSKIFDKLWEEALWNNLVKLIDISCCFIKTWLSSERRATEAAWSSEISQRFCSNTQCRIAKDSSKIYGRFVINSNFTRKFNCGIAVNICIFKLTSRRQS
jgi:hypothetical protein